VLISLYFHPRHQELAAGETGTYCGLGWHDGPGYAGKNWLLLRAEEDDGCWWEVDLDGYGYSTTSGFYANGAVMERSVSLVEEGAHCPLWDRHQVRDGTYFDLDGNVVSEIKSGTGRQTLFDANGVKSWELELRNGKRVELDWYWPTGHVLLSEAYDDQERRHGIFIEEYEDGIPKRRGRYEHGERVGLWYHLYPDGSVETLEDYGTDPSTDTHFARGERQLTAEERADAEIP
jgi:hypothetical protein